MRNIKTVKKEYLAALFVVFMAMLFACKSDQDTTTVIKRVAKNYMPVFISLAPDIAQVNIAYNYNFTVTDFDAGPQPLEITLSASDTCGGVVTDNGDGTGNYTFTPTTGQLGTQCTVGLSASDGKDETEQNTVVDIGDENAAPYFTSTAPTAATEDVLYTYAIAVADDNIPAQTLVITKSALDTCGGTLTDNGDGTGTYTFTPAENQGGSQCIVGLLVTDPMAASADQNTVITIAEDNKAPVNNAPANVAGDELTQLSFDINPTDPDVPAQTLTCSIVTNNCPGGALNGCTFEWTPTEAEGPNAGCGITTRVSDGVLTNDATTTITVNETNQAPTWTAGPANISVKTGQTYNAVNASAADADLPAQNLTCSNAGDTCSFGVSVSGSGSGAVDCNISFTASSTPQTCGVNVRVSDGAGDLITRNIQIAVQPCLVFVNDNATGANNGSSWANAFTVLQDAIDNSWASCEVWVAEGNYFRPVGGNEPVLTMIDNVRIVGGFVGNETSLLDRGDPADHPTVLDGENQSLHVVIGASNARLDGFTITGGVASGTEGGGMLNSGVNNLIITDCIFNGNRSGNNGGGMYNASSSLEITNCTFSGNSSDMDGGGMYNSSSSPTITNCVFSGNTAAMDYGGGIYNSSSSSTITDCEFNNNNATVAGGAISNQSSSSPTITNCTFNGNSANSGGGIHNSNSSSTITDCTFNGNYATGSSGGGMGISGASPVTVTNCVFNGNYAPSYGGGISISDSSPTITNCMFNGNSAGSSGGGMFVINYNAPVVTNCTFVGNSSGSRGGGITNNSSASTIITNSIFWGNSAPTGSQIYNISSTPVVAYTNVQGGYGGTGNINSDPLFVVGGLGNYYLSQVAAGQGADSPSLDTGDPASSSPGGTTATDNAPDTGVVDMGYHYPIP